MQVAVSGRFCREERRRGGTGRRSGLKILIYTRQQLGDCHLPTSGRLIERAHEVLTQAASDSKPREAAKLIMAAHSIGSANANSQLLAPGYFANASLFPTYGILVASPPYFPSSTSIS